MANIRENTKNGKVISYRFTACMERDVRGRQIRKYTTWTPPAGLTAAKAKKRQNARQMRGKRKTVQSIKNKRNKEAHTVYLLISGGTIFYHS